jgi:hypothetical protein
MKKLLLGSLVLLMFSSSIILFNISCNKDSDAQPNSNSSNCYGTINVTINFPNDAPPKTGRFEDNGISFDFESGIMQEGGQKYSNGFRYYQSFDNVGTTPQKVFTFKNIMPAEYNYIADIFGSNVNWIVKSTTNTTLKVEAGKTYNITIKSTDFK